MFLIQGSLGKKIFTQLPPGLHLESADQHSSSSADSIVDLCIQSYIIHLLHFSDSSLVYKHRCFPICGMLSSCRVLVVFGTTCLLGNWLLVAIGCTCFDVRLLIRGFTSSCVCNSYTLLLVNSYYE